MFFHHTSTKLGNYTLTDINWFASPLKKCGRILFGSLLLLILSHSAQAQTLEVPVKLEVESGNTDGIHMKVMKNGKEVQSQTASRNMKLRLEFNQTYVISFSKKGYINKTIEFNTNAPAERIKQGFESYKIGIKLFVQQDENVVVYNQPVGKIRYDQTLDEFNFETDYSKSILSAFNDPEAKPKEKDPVEKPTASPTAVVEIKEERKAEVKAEQIAKPTVTASTSGSSTQNSPETNLKTDKEVPIAPAVTQQKSVAPTADQSPRPKGNMGAGDSMDGMRPAFSGSDVPAPASASPLPEKITREDITEKNRIIIKIKVSSGKTDTDYSVVRYNWGGQYFFMGNKSITETLFTQWTGVRP